MAPNYTLPAPNLTAPLAPQNPQAPTFSYPQAKPLGIPTTITPKRKANNERTQAKRREGTKLADAAGFGPTPQVTLPPPPAPQTAVPFTPATYKPPNRGLEYLAMGVALLFPGAPIAKAAAGLLQGLNQGTQAGYERNEQAAEQTYETREQQAEVAHQNAVDQYNYGVQRAQVNAENLAAVEQNRAQLAARGINWVTGKPFTYPSLQQLTGKNTSAQGVLGAYTRLIQMASRNGDTGSVGTYTQAAKDYEAQVMQQDKDLQAMQRLYVEQQGANSRAEARIGAEEGMLEQREQFDTWLRTQPTPAEQGALQENAQRAMTSYRTALVQLTRPGAPSVQNQNGTAPLVTLTPPVGRALLQIQRSQNPQALAQWYAEGMGNARTAELFNEAGDAYAAQRLARGLPLLPIRLPSVPHNIGAQNQPPEQLLVELRSRPGWKPAQQGAQWGATDESGAFHPWSPPAAPNPQP